MQDSATSFRRDLPGSGIRAIFDRANRMERNGGKVLHLEIGRPDWKMPGTAAEAVKAAIDDDYVHYIANRGLLELRSALARDILATTGRSFDPESELVVTVGASEAICMAALALLGSGDEMIIPEPAWPHYRVVARLAGATPIPVPMSPADGYRLDADRLKKAITPRTRMLIVNTPGNPTGTVHDANTLRDIAALADKRGIFVVSDEVYQHFVYRNDHVSIGRFLADPALFLYVNSFSKSYAMTGWRVGVIGAERTVSDALNRVHQYLTVCGTAFAQRGAINVLENEKRQDELDAMKKAFAERRRPWANLMTNCKQMHGPVGNGAFYLFPRIDFDDMSDTEFCDYMLTKCHIAMVPGSVFGDAFDRHVRISYGGGLEVQWEAVRILKEEFHEHGIQSAA